MVALPSRYPEPGAAEADTPPVNRRDLRKTFEVSTCTLDFDSLGVATLYGRDDFRNNHQSVPALLPLGHSRMSKRPNSFSVRTAILVCVGKEQCDHSNRV